MRMKMKKTIIVLFLFLVGLNFVFAAESGLNESNNKSSTTLTLSLDKDKYLVGFSETESDFTHKGTITLSSGSIDKNTTTVSLNETRFYFFYKAITDASVSFKIAVTPLYFNGTKVTDDDSKKIDYTATITKINNKWNGADVTPSKLDTKGTTETNTCNLKGNNYTNYFATGIAEVVINSTDDLGKKAPGTYSGTIKVTLQSGS